MKGELKLLGPLPSGSIKIGFGETSIIDGIRQRGIWDVADSGIIHFFGSANLGEGVRISVWKNANLYFGLNFNLNATCTIVCSNKVKFGNDCLLAWGIEFYDTDFHKVVDTNTGQQINLPESIEIGDNNWISAGCIILKGSSTSKYTVIGANSVVNKKFEESNIIIAGNAAKVVKRNISWAF